jgi:Protein of unknown function, DUF547
MTSFPHERFATPQVFGINVYNLMMKYALIKVGIPSSANVTMRNAFYYSVCFNIGGYQYSFNDWEHGILRGNLKPPNGITEPFSRNDPRCQYTAKHFDPRIHFCLNRGTRGSPPLVRFSVKYFETELAVAASTFCENNENVKFDKKSYSIVLSPIFRTYRSDFTDSERKLPQVIADFMKGTTKRDNLERAINSSTKTIKVAYRLDDYSCPRDLRGFPFDPSTLEAERVHGLGKFLPSSPRKSPQRTKTSVQSLRMVSPSPSPTKSSSSNSIKRRDLYSF